MLNKKVDFPDKLLIKGLKKKSHKTFEIIFNHYYEKLYRLAFAYLMNQDLAEDTVQETFISLWNIADSLPDTIYLKNYLYTSVKHACLDYFKHLQVMDVNKDKLTEALIFSGTAENPLPCRRVRFRSRRFGWRRYRRRCHWMMPAWKRLP